MTTWSEAYNIFHCSQIQFKGSNITFCVYVVLYGYRHCEISNLLSRITTKYLPTTFVNPENGRPWTTQACNAMYIDGEIIHKPSQIN